MQVAADTTLVTTRRLQILATDCSQQLTFPRTQKRVTHTREALLIQEVYQILAGYPDSHDAQQLRHDPLFQMLVDVRWVAKFMEAKASFRLPVVSVNVAARRREARCAKQDK